MRENSILSKIFLSAVFILLGSVIATGQTLHGKVDSAGTACKFQTSEFLRTNNTTPEAIALQNKFIDPKVGITQQLLLAAAQKSAASGTPPPKDEKVARDEYGEPEKSWPERTGVAPYSTARFLDILAEVVPAKEGKAREESLETLVQEQQFRDAPFTRKSARCFQVAVARVLPTLPIQRQLYILGSEYYSEFESAELTEHILALYDTIEKQLKGTEDEAEKEAGYELGPREFYFYRTSLAKLVFEQSPDLGRDLIQKEIFSSRPRINIEAFRLLPTGPIPGLDDALASQIEEIYDTGNWYEFLSKLQVVEQFSSEKLFPKMSALYEEGKDDWHYEQEALFLSYFLRVAPDYARNAIEYRIEHHDKGSFTLFTEVASVRDTPELYAVAKENLANRNKAVAANAAYIFKYAKDRSVEPQLWQLLEQWHAEWSEKAAGIPYEEQDFQDSVVEALLIAGSRCKQKETVERLRSLYIKGKSVDGNIEFRQWQSPVHFAISGYSKDSATFEVQNCSGRMTLQDFKNEMPRFPKGTEFIWTEQRNREKRAAFEPIYSELAETANAHGMTIKRVKPGGFVILAP